MFVLHVQSLIETGRFTPSDSLPQGVVVPGGQYLSSSPNIQNVQPPSSPAQFRFLASFTVPFSCQPARVFLRAPTAVPACTTRSVSIARRKARREQQEQRARSTGLVGAHDDPVRPIFRVGAIADDRDGVVNVVRAVHADVWRGPAVDVRRVALDVVEDRGIDAALARPVVVDEGGDRLRLVDLRVEGVLRVGPVAEAAGAGDELGLVQLTRRPAGLAVVAAVGRVVLSAYDDSPALVRAQVPQLPPVWPLATVTTPFLRQSTSALSAMST
eukprot:SAG22_NODE_1184_length_5223_cov_14.962724_4_plen_271_part_00